MECIPTHLMEFGYSTKVLFLLVGAHFSRLCLSRCCTFSTKSVTAKTQAAVRIQRLSCIILILAVVTVTTLRPLQNENKHSTSPCTSLGLSVGTIRNKAHNSTLCKMIDIFAIVYMLVHFGVNILAYFCDGFTGKINEAKLTEYNHVWALDNNRWHNSFLYFKPPKSAGQKHPLNETMQIIDIYNSAFDFSRKYQRLYTPL